MAGGIGYGGAFKIGDAASPEVFTAVANVRSISGPSIAANAVDVTNMDSPGGYMESIKGLKDPGEITMELVMTGAGLTALAAEMAKTGPTNYKVVYPAPVTKTYSFAAFMTGMSHEAPVDDVMTVSVTYKIAGALTLT
jgi:predicted secreted protein